MNVDHDAQTLPAISVGSGRKNSQCALLPLDHIADDPVESLCSALRCIDPRVDGWWSTHTYRENDEGEARRVEKDWRASCGAALDLDYVEFDDNGRRVHAPLEVSIWNRLCMLLQDRELPACNVLHATPRGVRIVTLWTKPCTDPTLQLAAQLAVAKQLIEKLHAAGIMATQPAEGQGGIVKPGLHVDQQALGDLARMLFLPNAIVNGQSRGAELLVVEKDPFEPATMVEASVTEEELGLIRKAVEAVLRASYNLPVVLTSARSDADPAFSAAVQAFNEANPLTLPRPGSGSCPLCGHHDCFGYLPQMPDHWCCFSDNHMADSAARAGREYGVGQQITNKPGGGWGDSADVHAALRQMSVTEMLRADGYLVDPPPEPGIDFGAIIQNGSADPNRTSSPEKPAADGESVGITLPMVKIESFESALDMEPPPPLIEDVIHTGEMAVVYAPPSSFKTFVCLSMALAIGTGAEEWMGRRVNAAPTVYLSSEGRFGIGPRVRAWFGGRRPTLEDLGRSRISHERIDIYSKGGLGNLGRGLAAEEHPPKLIVVDTLALAIPGAEENSSADMGVVMDNCKALQEATGAALMLVHHSNKAGEAERGSSALRGAADVMIEIEPQGGKVVKLVTNKVKDRETPEPIFLRMEPVDLGNDKTSLAPELIDGQIDADESALRASRMLVYDFLAQQGIDTRTNAPLWVTTSQLHTVLNIPKSDLIKIAATIDQDVCQIEQSGHITKIAPRTDWGRWRELHGLGGEAAPEDAEPRIVTAADADGEWGEYGRDRLEQSERERNGGSK